MIEIRPAVLSDVDRLLEIYDPYVRSTAVSFEYEVPTAEEFRKRIENTMKKYPYLVLVEDSRIEGYAYAGVFKGRAAYDWACETSIYLDRVAQKRGLGRMLYEKLESELKKMGILNLYACIAFPETEDEYLTANSEAFHAHLGYRMVGVFKKCAYKFGRWYDMVWMEKTLGEHTDRQLPVRPYPEVRTERLRLVIPRPEDGWFYIQMMTDPKTMAYNAPWFPPDGCIPQPEEEWERLQKDWIGHEPERFYAFLQRSSDGTWVGDVNYHRSPDGEWYDMGIVIYAPERGKGFGKQGLHLLMDRAFRVDGINCLRNDFESTRDAAYAIHKAAGFRETGRQDGLIRLEMTREEYLSAETAGSECDREET